MAKFTLLCALVFAVVSTSTALKCLKCDDCENEPSTSSNCLPGMHVCMKTDVGSKVRKGCAPSLVCKLKDVDRTATNPLRSLKNIFTDLDFKKLLSNKKHAKDKIVHCCETDFCNGSPDKRVSLGLLAMLPFALYLLGC